MQTSRLSHNDKPRLVTEIKAAGNRRLAKKRVQCLNEALCFVSSSVLADSLVLRNPLLRQAPNRCASVYRGIPLIIKKNKVMKGLFFLALTICAFTSYGQDKYNYASFNKLTEVKGTEFVIARIENWGKMEGIKNRYLLFIN